MTQCHYTVRQHLSILNCTRSTEKVKNKQITKRNRVTLRRPHSMTDTGHSYLTISLLETLT